MPGIPRFIAQFLEAGFIIDAPRSEYARTLRTSKNSEAVIESVRGNPSTFVIKNLTLNAPVFVELCKKISV